VIAATDSSGGAGLTRDVLTLTDFRVDALCAVTAVTAQSDRRVTAIHHVPPDVIRAQVLAALETRRVWAIKTGMLGTRATVEAVVESLAAGLQQGAGSGAGVDAAGGSAPIVVDPVLVSSSGAMLLDAAGRTALLDKLLPLATLVTPNVPEMAALLGEPVAADEAELIQQGRRLLEFGSRAILLKGGHATGQEAVDWLIYHGSAENDPVVERITAKRVSGSSRGTGCALASGIAAGLVSGQTLVEACRRAKSYVLESLLTAPDSNETDRGLTALRSP
jgi:hydroxymethylpyrimidine/phosphomethylpyrimidine kinase